MRQYLFDVIEKNKGIGARCPDLFSLALECGGGWKRSRSMHFTEEARQRELCCPILYIVIPCYNEEEVLPLTNGLFLNELKDLIAQGKVSDKSRILFVNDGSNDATWDIVRSLSVQDDHFEGLCLSRNRGHQNALLAGLMEARKFCDVSISIDCDGQDDIAAMDRMVEEYLAGCDIVYGVRSSRETDTFFKRATAQGFYKFMEKMGVETVYNHADYRLLSKQVLDELSKFKEVNLFLRGMIPLIGYRATSIYYERHERVAGESHYPLKKMLALAINGVTSLSVQPIHAIAAFGFGISLLSFVGVLWAVVASLFGLTVAGWASTVAIVCFMGGIQLICMGVIGEYVGKIYMETKHRPRFLVSDKTFGDED